MHRTQRLLALIASVGLLGMTGACSSDRASTTPSSSSDTGGDTSSPDTAPPTFDASTPQDAGTPPDVDSPPDTDRPTPEDVQISWDWGRPDASSSAEPELEKIVPPSGPLEGGNRVRIVGEHLDSEVAIFVGSHRMETSVSGGSLVGRVPPGDGTGPVTVKALAPSGEADGLADGYTYVGGLAVDDVAPARIPVEGGVELLVEGRGFVEPTAVTIDGRSARRVRRVDEGTLRVVAPEGRAGPAELRITTPNETRVFEEAVTYYESLEIKAIQPASGSTSGGERITVEAEGFGPDVQVDLGGERAERLAIDRQAGTIDVRTPPHPSGTVDLSLRSGDDAAYLEDAYHYRAAETPTIAAVRPAHGSTAGGTRVVLIGDGFDASDASIQFGGQKATIVEASETRAVVETPSASSTGPVDVVLRHGSSEVAVLSNGFEYRTAIAIDRLSPETGPSDGGTTVTIRGSGLEAVERVTFGGLPAAIESTSASSLEVTTPAHAAGPVDVTLRGDDVEARAPDGFTYEAPLEVWGYSPVRGAVAGGTYVEVRGRGFSGELEVTLGGRASPEVRRIDRHNLYVYTPPHGAGEVPLVVKARGQQARGPYPYAYFNPASRNGGASGGSIRGAVNVTVLARGAGPIEDAFVMLSTRADSPHTGTTNQQGQITLSGPNVYGPQTVTAVAEGYSATTVHAIDAENLTLFLQNKNPPRSGNGSGSGEGEAPPRGLIRGEVTVPGKESDPENEVSADMAVVQTTRESIGRRRRTSGSRAVVLGEGRYELSSRVGDVAVVALCGRYNQQTEEFTPTFLGVERYLQVADGETYDVDLSCDIPLDRTLEVKLSNPVFAPDGPNVNRAEVYWDFGFAGVFPSPTVGEGLESVLEVPRQPALDGKLSDVTMTVVGGSYTGASSPSSETSIEGVADVSKTVALPPLVDVPEPVRPKPGETLEGREIRFQAAGPHYPDFYSIYLLNQKGRRFWHHVMPGDRQVVTFPDLPDLPHLPEQKRPEPMARGRAYILLLGIDAAQTTYNQFSYRDLASSRWRAHSTTRWQFRIAP